mmetsp:Transcript_7749/g.15109  ORF Transcript_7749/g.15109 Transcript_7749/m.15109 type:complete len:1972 (-) Transcript_7749:157-6072(-)|eukprot:CAMPEP_0167771324 /NCGR_PEP_ID=MMETSP0111_2-20121227/216_1 /TAXON_ID=91324 /ORGANISM="Lotharella globosa, Strain CCCM811" /LENGTH=1971 /DNA_ID=CAMNT_0007660667 /DNA_START=23 /DNA_END=5938 /DNA_ORIENTATION=-
MNIPLSPVIEGDASSSDYRGSNTNKQLQPLTRKAMDREGLPDLFGRLLKKAKFIRNYRLRYLRVAYGGIFYSKKPDILSDDVWLKQQGDHSALAAAQGEIIVRYSDKDVAMIPMLAVKKVYINSDQPHKLNIETSMGKNHEIYNFRVPDHDDLWMSKPSTRDGKRIPPEETARTWVDGIIKHKAHWQEVQENERKLKKCPSRHSSIKKRASDTLKAKSNLLAELQSETEKTERKKPSHRRTRSRRSGGKSMIDIIHVVQDAKNKPEIRRLEQMASYVPRLMLNQYLNLDMKSLALGGEKEHKTAKPMAFNLPDSCVVLADVSGFTNLNEAFSTVEGGAEKVTYHLNQYFTILLNIIEKHGGDCIKFAGDALIVLFKEEQHYTPQTYISRVHKHVKQIKPNRYTCLRAVGCALELGAQPAYKITGVRGFEKVKLTLHVAIGYGDLQALHVGGHNGMWEFLLTGAPFRQLAKAIDLSKQGDVVVTKEVWQEVQKHCKGTRISSYGTSEMKIFAVIHDVDVVGAKPITIPLELQPAIRRYVPRMVLDGLEQGMTRWLAELRQVSVIFVNLKGLLLNRTRNASLERTHEVLNCMQQVVACNQGYLRQFLVDDKGTVLIAVFGVPPFSWEDNGYRAVKTAIELNETLLGLNVTHSIGIASGMVYVGSVGSLSRREHAVVGDTVNSAARLSCKAPANTVWVDEATHRQAERKISMEACGQIKVKGKNNKVTIYRPLGFNVAANLLNGPAVIGRQEVLKICMQELLAVKEDHAKRMLWVTGPAGVGKTVVMGYIYRLARDNLNTNYTIGEATAVGLPHSIWGQLIERMMGLTDLSPALCRFKIMEAVSQSVELQTLVPYLELLNSLINCEFSPTPPSTKLLEEGKTSPEAMVAISHFTHNMLLELVKVHIGAEPSVWVVDDAHSIDYESLRLLFHVYDALPSVLMIFATRELKNPVSPSPKKNPEHKGTGINGDTKVASNDAKNGDAKATPKSNPLLASPKTPSTALTPPATLMLETKAGGDVKNVIEEEQESAKNDEEKLGSAAATLQSRLDSALEEELLEDVTGGISPPMRFSARDSIKKSHRRGKSADMSMSMPNLDHIIGAADNGLSPRKPHDILGKGPNAHSQLAIGTPPNKSQPSICRNVFKHENKNQELPSSSRGSAKETPGTRPLLPIHVSTAIRDSIGSNNSQPSVHKFIVPPLNSPVTKFLLRSHSHSSLDHDKSTRAAAIVGRSPGANTGVLTPKISPGGRNRNRRKFSKTTDHLDSKTTDSLDRRRGGSNSLAVLNAFKHGWRRVFNRRGAQDDQARQLRRGSGMQRNPPRAPTMSPTRRIELKGEGDYGTLVLHTELHRRNAIKIEIKGLNAHWMHVMLKNQLGVEKIPDRVLNFVVERAHSNPFVASEILLALKNKGIITIEKTRGVIFDEREDLDKLKLPTSVKSLIIMRLDQLPNHEMLVCKLASIFGITLPRGGLEYVWTKEGYPVDKLWPALISLEQRGIIHQPSSSEYTFTQPLVAEACIDTILYERRARIHLIIANYYYNRMKADELDTVTLSGLRRRSRGVRRTVSVEFLPSISTIKGDASSKTFTQKKLDRSLNTSTVAKGADGDAKTQAFNPLAIYTSKDAKMMFKALENLPKTPENRAVLMKAREMLKDGKSKGMTTIDSIASLEMDESSYEGSVSTFRSMSAISSTRDRSNGAIENNVRSGHRSNANTTVAKPQLPLLDMEYSETDRKDVTGGVKGGVDGGRGLSPASAWSRGGASAASASTPSTPAKHSRSSTVIDGDLKAGWVGKIHPIMTRLNSLEKNQRHSVDCDAVKQKIGDHYVSACLISGRCPSEAAIAALEHLNEMWKNKRTLQHNAQAAILVQKAFKIQSVYNLEQAKQMELFRKHKKLFDTMLRGHEAKRNNIKHAEANLQMHNRMWKEAIQSGDKKKANEIVNKGLQIYSKFRNQGIKSDVAENLEMFTKNRKLISLVFKEK